MNEFEDACDIYKEIIENNPDYFNKSELRKAFESEQRKYEWKLQNPEG